MAGVSRGTVTRVLNGERYVSAHARAAVESAAASLGYVPNKAAKNLVQGASHTVAIIVDEVQARMTGDANTSQMLLALNARLSSLGYRSVSVLLGAGDDDRSAAEFLRSGSADGVVLLSAEQSPLVMQAIRIAKLPAVLLCSPAERGEGVVVSIDDESAARDVTAELIAAGRQTVAMIAVAMDRPYGQARLRGFAAAVGSRFDPQLVVEATAITYDAGRTAITNLLDSNPGIDGIFVASDVVAAGALQALRDRQLRVPEDVGVVGFDGNEWSERSTPPLTTVRQPVTDLADTACDMLVDSIRGRPVASTQLLTTTLARSSA